MTIQQKPTSTSLSGNLLPFVITSAGLVNFTLKDGAHVLMQATYEPDSKGKVTIDIKDIVNGRLRYIKNQELAFYEQTELAKTFTATIDSTTHTFKVVRCEVLDLADTPTNWLRGNFLTWQPQNKAVVYNSPEWLTYFATEACTIKLKAHFPDETVQNVTLGTCQAGRAFTFDVQYARVAGLLGQKYPIYYDVWAESTGGARLSFIQRYYHSEVNSEQEQWFGFENSLGGFDTVRATGDTDLDSEAEHKLASVDDELQEYKIDTKRIYTKNTGHLNEYERQWLLDFQSARAKYIYYRGAIRPIAMVESDFNHSASDLPSDYTFKYRFVNQSSALNLIRNQEAIPSEITLPNIDAPNFTLPPRLSEYPRATLHEGVILPAFDPQDDKPSVTTFGALLTAAVFDVLQRIEAGEGGGELVNILRSTSSGEASDYSVFSSLRSTQEMSRIIEEALVDLDLSDTYLSKVTDDVAAGLIRFLQGVEFGDFQQGILTGKGGKIDKHGVAELESLTLRSFLEAPEFRKNRITLIGDKFVVGSGGIIEEVHPTGTDGNFDIKLKLEEGDINPFDVSDIIEGVYHHENGFGTTWIGVNSTSDEWMNVFMRPNIDANPGDGTLPQTFYPPVPMMHIAHRGNFVNKDRQSSIILSGREGKIVMYDNVNNWDAGRVASQWGKKQGLEFLENFNRLPIGKNDAVQYIHTLLYQQKIKVNYKGDVQKDYIDTGAFVEGRVYSATESTVEEVWHKLEKFRVNDSNLNEDGIFETTQTPSRGASDWTLILSLRDDMERGSSTYYAKPSYYRKGDRWILTEDTKLLENFYLKGQILEAVYVSGQDSDWRLMLIEGDEEVTESINLIRNYSFKEGVKHWGAGVPEAALVELSDTIPVDFYQPSINVIGDEYGYEYAITSENDELIIFDE